jgi:exonuclease SbcC
MEIVLLTGDSERAANAVAAQLGIDRVIAGHTGTVERCKGALAQLGDPAGDVARLSRREKEIAEAAADWTLLEKAMGRDGIQALEIDAAGPGVTSLANELLASCYGNRFSLAIETTGLKKDGGLKEVFDVRILDAQNGRDAKQGSGGEMVILDEALRLALAIYQTQQSGYELRTLWRDETAGALSPENADRYVQMLRRARELGGFEQVLFIAHSPDVWQQADSRLFVEAGTVTPDMIAEAA